MRAEQRERSGKNAFVKDKTKPLPNLIPDALPPSTTFESLWESEHSMLVNAQQRYDKHWQHARECTIFLSRCITSIDASRVIFGYFFSHMKKHHTLALFSAMRLHKVQAMMDLRQVLESGTAAAFAISNPEREHFADIDEQGILDPSQTLTKKRYAWLEANHPDKSLWIKETKDRINMSAAHANIVSANSVFSMPEDDNIASAPFFDVEDEYHVRSDLWLIGGVALTLMDLLYGANRSIKKIGFTPTFLDSMHHYSAESDKLLDEMRQTERFKTAMEKFGLNDVKQGGTGKSSS
jgi:hypothetical protein